MSEQELLLSKYINLGARVEIEAIERVLQADGTYATKKYESKVVDILDEEQIITKSALRLEKQSSLHNE